MKHSRDLPLLTVLFQARIAQGHAAGRGNGTRTGAHSFMLHSNYVWHIFITSNSLANIPWQSPFVCHAEIINELLWKDDKNEVIQVRGHSCN